MAGINSRIMDKLEKACGDDEAMKRFLRMVLIYELDEPGQYTKEYKGLIKENAERWGK